MTTTTNAERLALADRIEAAVGVYLKTRDQKLVELHLTKWAAIVAALRAQPADAGVREKEIIERCAEVAEASPSMFKTSPAHVRGLRGSDVAAAIRALNVAPPAPDPLVDLVSRFSAALLAKLKAAEAKYGYNNAWMRDGWDATCQEHMIEHLAKGDPLDVAAYCAFMWHHGWFTEPATPPQPAVSGEVREADVFPDEISTGQEATDLLCQWVEIPNAENFVPYQETMAFLGLPNSAGWVWAKVVKFERDFDAEQKRSRDLTLECLSQYETLIADQSAALAEARTAVADLRQALEHIRDGYDRADISHVDYRVGAYKAALTALASQEQP